MAEDPSDTNAIQVRLQTILRETQEVSDRLPEPLNLDIAISELEKTIEAIARLDQEGKRE